VAMNFSSLFRRIIRPYVPKLVLDFHRRRWVHSKQRHALYIIREFQKLYYYGAGSYGLPGESLIHSTY
jgi:hypothetical protein